MSRFEDFQSSVCVRVFVVVGGGGGVINLSVYFMSVNGVFTQAPRTTLSNEIVPPDCSVK
jgi:hypothetical protein